MRDPMEKAQKLLARLAVRKLAVDRPDLGIPVYRGLVTPGEMGWSVSIEGHPLDPRNDLFNHSPNGFAWGYAGSGPAQLALALLADYYRRRGMPDRTADQLAVKHHQFFKSAVIVHLERDEPWALTLADIDAALRAPAGV
jgi:hypothetical protein